MSVKLRNTNPLGYVDLPLIGRVGDPDTEGGKEPGSGCLVPGEVFEVSDSVAGEAPFWRPLADDDELDVHGTPKLEHRTDDGGEIEVHDLGHGLLAQVDNYELVGDEKPAAKKAAAKKKG